MAQTVLEIKIIQFDVDFISRNVSIYQGSNYLTILFFKWNHLLKYFALYFSQYVY